MRTLMRIATALLLGGIVGGAGATDIDIYTAGPSSGAVPNVLVYIDNSSNWAASNQAWDKDEALAKCDAITAPAGASEEEIAQAADAKANCTTLVEVVFAGADKGKLTQGQVEVRVLKAVLQELACGESAPLEVSMGLMFNSKSTADSTGNPAAYIRRAVQPLSEAACSGLIGDLDAIFDDITETAWKSASSVDYSVAMFEAFKYFGGYSNSRGEEATEETKGLPIGAKGYGPTRFSSAFDYEDGAAFTDGSKTTYKSPIASNSCGGGNYLVVIGNTFPNQENTAHIMTNYLKLSSDQTAQIYPSKNKTRYADEWARFLADTDISPAAGYQPLKTYTINVYNASESTDQTALLTSMAEHGGTGAGGAFKVDGNVYELAVAFKKIFTQIAAVNSAFASASLPISVNTQGTYLNQVFIGMFRPDGEGRPRWAGNLKQYHFALQKTTTGSVTERTLFLADADDEPAVDNAVTGFIGDCARSYWTYNTDSYWESVSGTPKGRCAAVSGSTYSDRPDGGVVEKGGVALKIRETDPNHRNLKSCSGECKAEVNLSISDTTLAAWVQGKNVGDGDGEGTYTDYEKSSTGMRPTVHGAVIHSRPLAISYIGEGDSEHVVVFYGADDGTFRAVNGDKDNTVGSTKASGRELWAFIAPESVDKLSRLRDNTPKVAFFDAESGGAKFKDYFFDGAIGGYSGPASGNGTGEHKIYIYPSMRRGGRMIYAFDVTTRPGVANPKPMWRYGCVDDTTCYGADAAKLGQTWSTPRVIRTKDSGDAANATLFAVFGGGYDNCEDGEPPSCDANSKGKGIFVLNATTGERLRHITGGLGRVAADLVPIDTNHDGYTDVIYAADTAGNLWRVNVTGKDSPDDWTITQIAKVADWDDPTKRRKFLYAPDVVRYGDYNIVLLGSGNREKPLNTAQAAEVRNRFYGFWDKYAQVGDDFELIDDSADCDVAGDTTLNEGCQLMNTTAIVAGGTRLDYYAVFTGAGRDPALRGWVIDLDTYGLEEPTEQVITVPATAGGLVHFSTFQAAFSKGEDDNQCSAMGTARGYSACFLHGGAACDANEKVNSRSSVFVGGGMPPSPVTGRVEIVDKDGNREVVPFLIGGKGSSPLEASLPEISVTSDKAKVYRYKVIDE